MTTITFVAASGSRQTVAVLPGLTVMESAVQSGVNGIDGDCGGACACGTCHIWMDQDAFERLGSPSAMEADMLEGIPERHPTSRLSCQITAADLPADLVFHVPGSQSW